MNDDVVIAKMKMIDAGIVTAMTGNQVKTMMSSLSLQDQKIAKRKFRKIWRRIAKKDKTQTEFLGLGSESPTKAQIRHRSAIVALYFVKANKTKEDHPQLNLKRVLGIR